MTNAVSLAAAAAAFFLQCGKQSSVVLCITDFSLASIFLSFAIKCWRCFTLFTFLRNFTENFLSLRYGQQIFGVLFFYQLRFILVVESIPRCCVRSLARCMLICLSALDLSMHSNFIWIGQLVEKLAGIFSLYAIWIIHRELLKKNLFFFRTVFF